MVGSTHLDDVALVASALSAKMFSRELLPIVITTSGAGLILLLTLHSILPLIRFRPSSGYHPLSDVSNSHIIYKDEDGTATPDSEAVYSGKLAKIIICIATPLGFAASLASAVLSTVHQIKTLSTQRLLVTDWITFAAWVHAPRYLQ